MEKKETLTIQTAEYQQDYIILFYFNDGKVVSLDFYPFLSKPYQNPMTSKYLDVKKFKKFEIVNNLDISWNNYEMCFPFETLYNGKF